MTQVLRGRRIRIRHGASLLLWSLLACSGPQNALAQDQAMPETSARADETRGEEAGTAATDAPWWPVPIIMREPPFSDIGSLHRFDYVPLPAATPGRRLCLSVSRPDFATVAAVIQGVTREAERQNAVLNVLAVGSEDVERQRRQIRSCIPTSDAILVVPTQGQGLEDVFRTAKQAGVHVINVGIASLSEEVDAKIVPDPFVIGEALGQYLADLYPVGAGRGRVLWFPGPRESGFAAGYDAGFRHAVQNSAVEIVGGDFTELDDASLRSGLSEALADDEVDAIAGVGLMIEVAMDRVEKQDGGPILLSTSMTDAIATAIAEDRVAAAIDTRPEVLGLIAADVALRAVEKKDYLQDVQARVSLVDETNITAFLSGRDIAPTD